MDAKKKREESRAYPKFLAGLFRAGLQSRC